jgi:hypothetical protein
MATVDCNLLLKNLKDEYFDELKNAKIELKPLRILKKIFMIALPFSKNIYYNRMVLEKCNDLALKAVLVHELYHRVQFQKLNFFQKLSFVPRYHLSEKYRIQHEIQAHIATVKKGFGKELLELNKFVKQRYPKKIWDRKLSNYYLTEKEIKGLMKKNFSGQFLNDTKT